MNTVEFLSTIGVILLVVLIIAAGIGYVANIYQLCHCDFETPLKAEILRVVGIFIPPAGMIMGYCDISDGKDLANNPR